METFDHNNTELALRNHESSPRNGAEFFGLGQYDRSAFDADQVTVPEIGQEPTDGFTCRADGFADFLLGHVEWETKSLWNGLAILSCAQEQELSQFGAAAGSKGQEPGVLPSLVKLHAEMLGDPSRDFRVSMHEA